MESPNWRCEKTFLTKATAHIDKHIRLLLDNDKTRYILVSEASRCHQISSHYYCTTDFLNTLFATVLHPDTKGALNRVFHTIAEDCSVMRFL